MDYNQKFEMLNLSSGSNKENKITLNNQASFSSTLFHVGSTRTRLAPN